MDPIARQEVEDAMSRFRRLHPREKAVLKRLMQVDQPAVHEFLRMREAEDLSPVEGRMIWNLALIVWFVMSQVRGPLKPVSRRTLERLERANHELLKGLRDLPEGMSGAWVDEWYSLGPQPEVLALVLTLLFGIEMVEEALPPAVAGEVAAYAKTLIDAYNEA